jgi:hypothetical protein
VCVYNKTLVSEKYISPQSFELAAKKPLAPRRLGVQPTGEGKRFSPF